MGKFTKVSRRFFNKIALSILGLFGVGGRSKSLATENKQDYMEVLIIPEEFRYPYSHKVRQVLYNHKIAGKSKAEIKEFILSQAKVIKVPIK